MIRCKLFKRKKKKNPFLNIFTTFNPFFFLFSSHSFPLSLLRPKKKKRWAAQWCPPREGKGAGALKEKSFVWVGWFWLINMGRLSHQGVRKKGGGKGESLIIIKIVYLVVSGVLKARCMSHNEVCLPWLGTWGAWRQFFCADSSYKVVALGIRKSLNVSASVPDCVCGGGFFYRRYGQKKIFSHHIGGIMFRIVWRKASSW